jgi:hypothetical protein
MMGYVVANDWVEIVEGTTFGANRFIAFDNGNNYMRAFRQLRFDDNIHATFGSTVAGDMRIYHDTNHSYIQNVTGNFSILLNNTFFVLDDDDADVGVFALDTTARTLTIGGASDNIVTTHHGNFILGTNDNLYQRNNGNGTNGTIFWGATDQAGAYYNGTNLVIDPRISGSGDLVVTHLNYDFQSTKQIGVGIGGYIDNTDANHSISTSSGRLVLSRSSGTGDVADQMHIPITHPMNLIKALNPNKTITITQVILDAARESGEPDMTWSANILIRDGASDSFGTATTPNLTTATRAEETHNVTDTVVDFDDEVYISLGVDYGGALKDLYLYGVKVIYTLT